MTTNLRTLIEYSNYERCYWQQGTVLVRQGSSSDSLFFVVTGQVRTWVERPGRTDLVDVARSGELAGTTALLDPGRSPATLHAAAYTTALRISRHDLDHMWRTQPRLAQQLHRAVVIAAAGQLRDANTTQAVAGAAHGNS